MYLCYQRKTAENPQARLCIRWLEEKWQHVRLKRKAVMSRIQGNEKHSLEKGSTKAKIDSLVGKKNTMKLTNPSSVNQEK